MAQGLAIKHKRNLHWIAVVLWLSLFTLLAVTSWFAYRYFTTGELPPALSVSALTADPDVDESAVTSAQVASYSAAANEARYLSVSTLGINKARIFKTGVDSTNQLALPGNIHDVGWYQKSTVPGQGYGVVLLTGHNKGISSDGVFSKLSTIQQGATITIERGDGKQLNYRVEATQTMTIEEASRTGMKTMLEPLDATSEGLTLMTNAGNWVPRIKQFDQRLIVRAVASE